MKALFACLILGILCQAAKAESQCTGAELTRNHENYLNEKIRSGRWSIGMDRFAISPPKESFVSVKFDESSLRTVKLEFVVGSTEVDILSGELTVLGASAPIPIKCRFDRSLCRTLRQYDCEPTRADGCFAIPTKGGGEQRWNCP